MDQRTAATAMTTDVVAVAPATSFAEVVRLLVDHAISAVPVVADDGVLLGVVSEADLLDKQEFPPSAGDPGRWAGRAARARWRRSRGETAATVMTTPVRTVGPEVALPEVAALLAAAGVRRLFVVDDHHRLLGVLARRDVLAAFVRHDGSILADVERLALDRVRWSDPTLCRAEVRGGVVTLRGTVADRAERDLAGRLARSVPGVVAVHNLLRHPPGDGTTTPD